MKSASSIFILTTLFLSSCAQRIPITGGPADTTAPKAEHYYPKDTSVNFNRQKIEILFNEYITLKNTQNFLISPPLPSKPQLNAKGKILTISFKDKLPQNTTFKITLPDMISDINEGSTYQLFTYTFSTGPEIDSCTIKGKCVNAYSTEPVANCYVALYEKDVLDTNTLNTQPTYITRTDGNGNFRVDNIRRSNFFIVSYFDLNSDLLSDKTALFGFTPNKIQSTTKDTSHTLKMSLMRNKERDFLSVCRKLAANKVLISLNNPDDVKRIKSEHPISFYSGVRNDTLIVFSFTPKEVFTADSITFCLDTNKRNVTIETSADLQSISDSDTITFFTADNAKINYDKIHLFEDTIKISRENSLSFFYKWDSEKTYKITFDSGAITDENNTYFNFKTSFPFTTKSREETSDIAFTINNDLNLPLLFELIRTDKREVYKTGSVVSTTTVKYNGIPPGKYRIKLILDANMNGMFDEGDFNKLILPENVYIGPILDIKPNWEVSDIQIGMQ